MLVYFEISVFKHSSVVLTVAVCRSSNILSGVILVSTVWSNVIHAMNIALISTCLTNENKAKSYRSEGILNAKSAPKSLRPKFFMTTGFQKSATAWR